MDQARALLDLPLDSVDTTEFADAFAQTGYVELTAAFAPNIRNLITKHVQKAIDSAGRRRDIIIPVTGNSPRRYRLAGRSAIESSGTDIQTLYRQPQLLAFINRITNVPTHRVPYLPEEYIATRFEEPGDTHGWHWDDYAFALIWVTASPDPSDGGTLEFIPNVGWDKENPRVDYYVQNRTIHRRHPPTDSVYLLRADTILHRVTPLKRAVRREILCLSFATQNDLDRAISHETLEQLYAPTP